MVAIRSGSPPSPASCGHVFDRVGGMTWAADAVQLVANHVEAACASPDRLRRNESRRGSLPGRAGRR